MSLPARANQTLSNHCSSTRATSTISFRIPSPSSLSFCGARLRGSTSPARRYRRGHHRWEPTRRVDAAWLRPYFFGGPIRCQVRFGFWVGGKGVSPGSMVTVLGLGTEPPRGPRSMYSPGRDGFSPGFWSRDITSLPIKSFAAAVKLQRKTGAGESAHSDWSIRPDQADDFPDSELSRPGYAA